MNERPILFKPDMVKAILDGRKSQTRRVVKNQMGLDPGGIYEHQPGDLLNSPYGYAGDLLWVRELWCAYGAFAKYKTGRVFYKADCPGGENPHGLPWKPSIHMPRWASRLTLEIAAVRVERVQNISYADAIAEGVTYDKDPNRLHGHWESDVGNPVFQFKCLWDSIHSKDGYEWKANPWVWVLTFKRVEP